MCLKEKLLHTMVATEDVEEVEILKARFETFDNEMKANADKVEVVNQLSRQLLQNEHPNAEDVIVREDNLNKRQDHSAISYSILSSTNLIYLLIC